MRRHDGKPRAAQAQAPRRPTSGQRGAWWSERRLRVNCVSWRRRLAERGPTGLGVPSAWRRGDFVCPRIRLRGLEDHELRQCGGERDRIDLAGDFVALRGGVQVALLSGEREPQPRLAEVLVDAESARVQDREIVLAVAYPEFGGPSEPFRRFGIVRSALAGPGAHDREIVRGSRIPALSPLEIPAPGGRRIAGHANSLLIHRAEPILPRGKAERGGAFEPPGRRWLILRQTSTFEQAHREFILRIGLATGDRVAQRGGNPGRDCGHELAG